MDTSSAITHLSLCTGYGGIDLGLRRAIPNLRTVAYSEIEAFACANLVSKMEAGLLDPAPIWTNLKTFPWEEFRGRVGILSGGYPCQPFSSAGKRLGTDDPRHLWPFIREGLRAMRPAMCFFENVEGHLSLGLSTVISDLEEDGYRCAFGLFSASEVGAPHRRKRVFILAYSTDFGHEWRRLPVAEKSQASVKRCGVGSWPSRPGQLPHEWEPPRVVGNLEGEQGEELGNSSSIRPCKSHQNPRKVSADKSGEECGLCEFAGASALPRDESQQAGLCHTDIGAPADGQTQPSVGGDPYGLKCGMGYAELCVSCDNRADELRLLGNGVVPATAELAFRILFARLLGDAMPLA